MSNSTEAHYNNREECSHVVATSFTVVLSTLSLLAVTGNLLVIITFIKTANLRTSPNYYIVNMAVSDLIAVILNWPLYATEGMLKPGGTLLSTLISLHLLASWEFIQERSRTWCPL